MKKLKKTITFLLMLLAFTFTNTISANNGGGQGTSNNYGQHNCKSGSTQTNGNSRNNNGGKTCVPLDGGLSILLLGAAAFGVKRLRDNKKQ